MNVKKTPSTDLTGARREALLKEQAAEAKKRQEEITLVNRLETEARENEVTDTTVSDVPIVIDEVTSVVDVVDEDNVVIRVAEDLERVTIGEKTYDFEAGKKYKVERNVADVLRWAGKLYDRA